MSRCFPVRRLYVLTRFRETIRRVSLRGSESYNTLTASIPGRATTPTRSQTKGNITHAHLLASETTGALTPEVIRLLHVLDTSTKDAQGHNSTQYGLGRASPQPVLLPARTTHLAAVSPSCASQAASRIHRPRRCPYDPQPRSIPGRCPCSRLRGLSERPLRTVSSECQCGCSVNTC